MHVAEVIPVPAGMTPEEAFEEMEALGRFLEYRWWKPRFHWPLLKWAVIEYEEDDDG